ncbi:MAG: DUF2065 domain-containing protein [Desulfobacteraceae bacterium]|jgi:uncharacterized protein|nr:DUF2065 domain-containing protein [Desulfobacteraceae bacterium]
MEFFLSVIGMVMVVEGLPYFAFPNRMKIWMRQLLEIPDATLRILGLLLMLTGYLFVYFGRS